MVSEIGEHWSPDTLPSITAAKQIVMKNIGVVQAVGLGHRPGQRHGQREGHGVGAPACAGGEGDDDRHHLQHHRQGPVGDARAEQLDQEDPAAGLFADVADGDGQAAGSPSRAPRP